MKVQFDGGRLRLRLSRAEFDGLQGGDAVAVAMAWPAGPWRLELARADAFTFETSLAGVRIGVPAEHLASLAARLPSRDGLRYALDLPDGPVEVVAVIGGLRLDLNRDLAFTLHDRRPLASRDGRAPRGGPRDSSR